MARRRWLMLGLAAITIGSCDGGKTRNMGAQVAFAGCDGQPAPPPATLGLGPFYAKYLDGFGTPVLSSSAVDDRALAVACRITGELVSLRSDLRAALAAHHVRVAVLGTGEVTTDIPEYADLYAAFPGTDWNSMRGIGATQPRPVLSAGEENLLCLPGDVVAGQSILVEMLAYALHDLAIGDVDAQFRSRLQAVYAAAMSSGLWAGTRASENADDYWVMGAQTWFSANLGAPAKTRAELVTYDAALAGLLAGYLPADDWRPSCY